jgi:hypothetical protein
VAEGVETARQAEAVRAIGCRLGQGWYWSPAVPAAAVAATMAEIRGTDGRVTKPPQGPERPQRDEPPPPQTGPVQTRRIIELHRAGASPRTIAAALNQAGMLTSAGRRWHPVQVTRVIKAALGPVDPRG